MLSWKCPRLVTHFFLIIEFECILQWKKCFLLQERIGKKASFFFFWIQERSAKKFSFQVHVNYNVQIILRKPLWEDFHWALYGGTSDRQDVMNTVWVGSICFLKNLTSFMYLMQKESWTATWKTWTQLVIPRKHVPNASFQEM